MAVDGKQVERFTSLFNGLRRAYGYSRAGKKRDPEGKVQSFNKTVIGELTEGRYRRHMDGEESLGVVPIDDGDVCYFGAIDIDEYDGLDHKWLVDKLRERDLPLVVCRSKSNGAHVYAFFKEAQDAHNVRTMLMRISVVLGQPGVEIFPKQTELADDQDVGNWINLPYFGGTRTAVGPDGADMALDEFLDYADASRMDTVDELQVETPSAFNDGPPCLQQLAHSGTPAGARNNALIGFGVYAKKKYPDEWEDMLEEYNRRHMTPPLAAEEVINTIKSLRRKDYGYKCNDAPMVNLCNRELCLSRKYGIQPGSDSGASVQIDGITKINTDPPLWIVGVEGKRIHLKTSELMDQNAFRRRVFEKTNKIMGRMKGENWEALLQTKVQEIEVEEAPSDASNSGQLLEFLERWLTDHPVGTQRSELLLGKPVQTSDGSGRVHFRSNDFYDFLQRNRFTDMKKPDIWAALREEKTIRHEQLNVQGRCVQTWVTDMPDTQDDIEPTNVAEKEEF